MCHIAAHEAEYDSGKIQADQNHGQIRDLQKTVFRNAGFDDAVMAERTFGAARLTNVRERVASMARR